MEVATVTDNTSHRDNYGISGYAHNSDILHNLQYRLLLWAVQDALHRRCSWASQEQNKKSLKFHDSRKTADVAEQLLQRQLKCGTGVE